MRLLGDYKSTRCRVKLSDKVGRVLRQKAGAVFSVSPDQTVYEALQEMADKEIGSLLVMSGEKLLGILSERDYARHVVLEGKSSKETLVRELMVTPVIFVTTSHTVDDCMTIMTNLRVRHLPVMEDERVVGLVSIGDLVKWIISEQEGTIQHLENYIAGSYPG
jgi:CBS domain-containing protein